MRGTWQSTDSGGSGGLVLAVIIAALAIGSGAASAAVSAIITIIIVLGAVIGLAVLGGMAWLVWRARSGPARPDRPGQATGAPAAYQLPPDSRPRLEESSKPAIEPPRETHLHFHVSAAEVAAIMRHYEDG